MKENFLIFQLLQCHRGLLFLNICKTQVTFFEDQNLVNNEIFTHILLYLLVEIFAYFLEITFKEHLKMAVSFLG